MTAHVPDPLLQRLERRAALFCAAAAGLSALLWPGRGDVAGGVLGGGALAALSYWAIRSSVDGLLAVVTARAPGDGAPGRDRDNTRVTRPRIAWFVLRFAGRYALLALLAYAMIARLRLHPIGVLVGVSSVVVAASLEALASLSTRRRGRQGPSGTD